MISENFNFGEFFNHIKDLDFLSIIEIANREIYEVKRMSSRRPGAADVRKQGSGNYIIKLESLLFFLQNAGIPDAMNEYELGLLKVLVINLIEKGQFKSSILEVFNK